MTSERTSSERSSTEGGLRVPIADLLRRPGASRAVSVATPVSGLVAGGTEIPVGEPVQVDVLLERIPEGVVVRGEVQARWQSECKRCVQPVAGDLSVHVDELFESDPLEGETYALADDHLDLEPLVRDALILELPQSPLCRAECLGLCPSCGIDRNEATCDCRTVDEDPRWAALRSLDL